MRCRMIPHDPTPLVLLRGCIEIRLRLLAGHNGRLRGNRTCHCECRRPCRPRTKSGRCGLPAGSLRRSSPGRGPRNPRDDWKNKIRGFRPVGASSQKPIQREGPERRAPGRRGLLDKGDQSRNPAAQNVRRSHQTDKSLIELNPYGTWTVKIATSSTTAIGTTPRSEQKLR